MTEPHSTETKQEHPSPADAFERTLHELHAVLINIISDAWESGWQIVHPTLLDAAMKYISEKKYSCVTMIETFIFYSNECWDMIHDKNEKFFEEKAWVLFRDIPKEAVVKFKELFLKKNPDTNEFVINQSDRDSLWVFFFLMVRVSIHYIHENRIPFLTYKKFKNKEGIIKTKAIPGYEKVDFMKEIDLNKHCDKWKIDRKFVVKESEK